MACVLSNILDGIVALMEGTAGTARVIEQGSFKSVQAITQSNAVARPRPFVLHADDEAEDESLPSDVAGNYEHRAWHLQLVVGYADKPNDRRGLQKTMADDEQTIRRTLGYPLNWNTVQGWQGADLQSSLSAFHRQPLEPDHPDGPEIHLIVVSIVVSYREDMT
jgi:hypothetical protein